MLGRKKTTIKKAVEPKPEPKPAPKVEAKPPAPPPVVKAKIDPPPPGDPSVRQILKSPTNCLGEKFNPQYKYTLVSPENVSERLANGWTVEIPKVLSRYGDQFALMGKKESA
jgi:hypothetical protein